MTPVTRVLCILLMAATLTGCGRIGLIKRDTPTFEGQRFSGRVSSERRNRQVFTVTVNGVSKSLEGAIASAEYRATQHCIQYFGTSDIDWTVGPETDRQALRIANDSLTFRGTCRDI